MIVEGIHPDSDFSNSTVPVGDVLVFVGYLNGVPGECVTIRCKLNDGTFINLTGCEKDWQQGEES